MSALSLTMRDLSRALDRLDLDDAVAERAENAARYIETGLLKRGQPATATIQRGSVTMSGPRLWDREHGEDGGNLEAVLRERGTP